jgi:hypothetical protein
MNSKYLGVALGIVILACVAVAVIIARPTGKSTKKTTGIVVTIDGPLVGEDKHKAIRLSVNPSDRGMEILTGYNQTVERSQHYANTQAGYATFLHAINNVGFASKRASTISDERGACPSGFIYYYDLYDASGQLVNHTWGSSCSVELGTFAGVGPSVRALFQAQMTDYEEFTAEVFPAE